MANKIVTIHQPDFMPWLGFFVKVWRSDTFVVLDHVKNNVKDGSWFRRVRFLASGQPAWISIPLDRPVDGPFLPLNQMTVSQGPAGSRMFDKYKRTIRQSYLKATYYAEFSPLFESYFDSNTRSLAERNMAFIRAILGILGIETEVVFSSDLGLQSSSNELLVDIINAVGGTTYLSGDGASGYQDNALFDEAGIAVMQNRFSPTTYEQVGTRQFVPGLSVLDALFNLGAQGTRDLLVCHGKTA